MPFHPQGKFAWDLWFAQKDGDYHIFYLQADASLCTGDPDKQKNISTVGHALVDNGGFSHVSQEPVFQASVEPDTWDNLSIWTGSVVKDPLSESFLMFYTARKNEDEAVHTPSEYQRPQNIGLAFSSDLVNWQRHPSSVEKPVIPNPGTIDFFDGVAWRDPFITKIGDYYYCLVTARLVPNEKYSIEDWDQGGTIAYIKSKDLYNWTAAKPEILVASSHFYEMEVPQLFSKVVDNKRIYYLVFCCQEVGCSKVRKEELPESESKSGTYIMISAPQELDSKELPTFSQPAKLLIEGLYAGRILNPHDTEPTIYGFQIGAKLGTNFGGIISARVRF